MLFIQVTENWKSSQIFINSDAKKLDLVQVFILLKKSEEFWFLRYKGVIDIKKIIIFTFLSLFCLHQTSKKKTITGNIIHNSTEVILLCRRTVWVISFSTSTLEREDKI